MDKNAIKKYAVWARNELIARVSQKAQQYGITAEEYSDKNADSVNGVLLSATEKKQRQALIAKIDAEGFEQVMEEVAYTWFNRFTALRFMEVNNYLPSHTRVFTNEANEFKTVIQGFKDKGYAEVQIQEYIKRQLQEDQIADQISLKEFIDPFKGSKNTKA